MIDIKQIVVPVDGSAGAKRAGDAAVSLARALQVPLTLPESRASPQSARPAHRPQAHRRRAPGRGP